MLSSDDFLIVIYNYLEVGSRYRSDLVDLFGTPDGSRKGYLGSIDRPLRWDWGDNGFRKIVNIMHFLSGQNASNFETFYHTHVFHKENIISSLTANCIIDGAPQMLYVFKLSSKRIPAFTATIHDISWTGRRIWIEFEPKRYLVIDPVTWRVFWDKLFTNGREDPNKWFDTWDCSWKSPRPSIRQIEEMLHSSSSLDQYHIIPQRLLLENMQSSIDSSMKRSVSYFIKDISKVTGRLKLRVPTDNQAFWGILSEFTGRSQVRGTVELEHNRTRYAITGIPANTISEDSLVFKQEIGTARTICQVMLDIFGKDYLDLEFTKGDIERSILDSTFLKRAVKVYMIARTYEKKFGETDFDYQLDLSPLSSKYPNLDTKILFDLTAGLWNKSSSKTKEEFLEQWVHNLIRLPERNHDICVFWHYGLTSEVKDGTYNGQEVGDFLLSMASGDAMKYKEGAILKAMTPPRTVLMPFFRDTPMQLEKELDRISSNRAKERRDSVLYKSLREQIERLLQS